MTNNPYKDCEKELMDCLARAWELFLQLKVSHPSHNGDFANGIHQCQNVIIHRIVQRDYSETFPTYGTKNEF